MATWYWKGQVSSSWATLINWWANADGTGSHPATSPWMTADTVADDLLDATVVTNAPTISLEVGNGLAITGVCSVTNVSNESTIYGGTFNASVTNNSVIYDGTFNASVTNTYSVIYGGTFNASVTGGEISGGTFNGSVTGSNLSGGTFNDRLSIDGGVTWLYSPLSPSIVSATKVLAGNSNVGASGTLTLPPGNKVDSTNGVYGVAGTGSTPTLNVAALEAAAASDQLATDVSAVDAAKADILATRTLLTVQGEYTPSPRSPFGRIPGRM